MNKHKGNSIKNLKQKKMIRIKSKTPTLTLTERGEKREEQKIFISLQNVVSTSFPIIKTSNSWSGKPKTSSPIFFIGHCTVAAWKLTARKNYIKQSAWSDFKPIMNTKEIKLLTKNLELHIYKESWTPYPPMKQACAEQSNHHPVF